MFGLITKRGLKKAIDFVFKDIQSNKEEIKGNSKEILDLKLQLSEMKGIVSTLEVREATPRSPNEPTKYHKKAKQFADKVEIVNEIKALLNKGLSTTEIYDEIVSNKGLCGKTCFYKYLKKVRSLSPRTPRTIKAN